MGYSLFFPQANATLNSHRKHEAMLVKVECRSGTRAGEHCPLSQTASIFVKTAATTCKQLRKQAFWLLVFPHRKKSWIGDWGPTCTTWPSVCNSILIAYVPGSDGAACSGSREMTDWGGWAEGRSQLNSCGDVSIQLRWDFAVGQQLCEVLTLLHPLTNALLVNPVNARVLRESRLSVCGGTL